MENSLSSAIQKMGSTFLVAAFVPAMAFIIILSLTFNDLLPNQLRFTDAADASLIQSALNLLLFTTILGFTLYTLSTFIYKVFEGYIFIFGIQSPIGRSFLSRQNKRFQRNEKDRQLVESQIKRIKQKILKEQERLARLKRVMQSRRLDRYNLELKTLLDHQYSIASYKNENFPPNIDNVLPTRFGNILRAAEMYAGIRYQIDSVPLWGRLAHVIPPEGMEKIDHANNQCLFLLNGSLLASIYTLICLLVSIYGFLQLLFGSNYPIPFSPNLIFLYLILGILAGATAWLFYVASLYNVSRYGSMIRTAYDLYRFKLIEALHLELPKTIKQERQLWRRISYFIVGNEQWEHLQMQEFSEKYSDDLDVGFEYIHPIKPETKETKDSPLPWTS